MTEPNLRPDPDELLARVQHAEAKSKRGALKIFFGFAPGVGKTYRMLQVARDLVSEQKLDVVVGIVEDHRRADTAAMALGLELLPRRTIEHRGHTLEEFDLDAAVARRPKVLLVDELAHTNAPGSRHPKRWQDVEEVLDAGIDVLTTMNVQHVESLNDVVAQITGVSVRETVPDAVLDRADALELIDIAPEELLQRLREGKVYLNEQVRRATEHFFRRGNLLALRELALRRTAQHVDEDVREYREEHGVASTWPAGERILVCVGPAPSSARLIRAAARMAAGLRCAWVAGYVEPTLSDMSASDRQRLEQHLRVAESLGASVTRVSGANVAEVLLAYARKHNVTRLVIGKPTHSRLRDRLRGSLLDAVVRGSGDIDVHVINGDGRDEAGPPSPSASTPAEPVRHYAAAAVLVALALGVSFGLRTTLNLPDLDMPFLLAVLLSGVWFGRGPSLLAAALAVACYDFFFVPPYFTFSVSDQRYVLTFAMMFGVGFAMSALAGRLKRQEREALTREERTAVLYAFTRELATTDQPPTIAAIAARHAADVFSAQAVVLGGDDEGPLEVLGAMPSGATIDEKALGVARWCHAHDTLAGLGTNTLPGATTLCAPLKSRHRKLGVLALTPKLPVPLLTDQRAFLDIFCRQVAIAFERAQLAHEAQQSALRAKTEEMRSSLLSTVSHDLRTPLASITGAATSLRDDPALSAATKAELVEAIVDQAERLERLVSNLLDMTRLESGGLALKKDWVPLDEVIGSALTRLEGRLEGRKITVDLPADVPLVRVDPLLFEQVFVNVLENAIKYTPQGSGIDLVARREAGDSVSVAINDRGPGLAPGTTEKVFDKFYRGPHATGSGAGLGLPICKGIVEAHGGRIGAENRPEGGARFFFSIPSGGPPPILAGEGATP
jgi:two-component system, OmpR family, sensor histidine kinase KdpD